MKFSIIIIGYNQKDVICDAVRSALEQSYRDIEVIYVDDASTDGSVKCIQSAFADDRLRIVQGEENRGSVITRLLGIKASRGDWCLLVDGDDTLCLDACETLSEIIKQQDSKTDIIGFGANIICTHDVPLPTKEWMERMAGEPMCGLHSSEELLQIQYAKREKAWVLWNKCFKLDVLRTAESAAAYETFYRLTDYYLCFIACSEAKQYYGIRNCLYNYNYGSGISLQELDLDGIKRYMSGHKATALLKDYAGKKGNLELYEAYFNEAERETVMYSREKIQKASEEDRLYASQAFIDTFGPQGLLTVFAEISNVQAVTARQRAEIEGLSSSTSYRIGRAVTWLPRKVRGGVRCFQDHGAGYTVRRTLYHMGLWKDEEKE